MNQTNKHRGTIVPMITPFTKELTLDERAAERMVDRLASHGLGAFVLGTTGEAASVPKSLRKRLVEIAVKASNGRVPVYSGIGDNCTIDSIEIAKDFLEMGVDAVVAPLPAYYPLTEQEILDYFSLLSSQINGAIVPYNIPQATHMSIPVEVVKRISEWENIVGFKDSENTAGRLEQVAKLGNRSDFSIFMGVARLSFDALKNGYDGLVPSSGNIAPQLWIEFEEFCRKKSWEEALTLQNKLNEIALIFQSDRTLGQSIAALKGCSNLLKLCETFVLPPLQTIQESERQALEEQLAKYELLASAYTPEAS